MPTFQRTIKAIQYADDGPGALGAGEDAEALTWNNATGHFITNPSDGGGGTSDHAALTHLDYVSSNHTGFAGTGEANTFTRKQTLQSSISDVTLSAENLDNSDFADDLSFWDDVDSSGWAWDAGAALKTPGLSGYLTQNNVGINEGYLYVLEVQVTGMTAGVVEARVMEGESTSIYLAFTEDGTQSAYATLIGPTVDISVYADEAFDGRVEYVSLKSSSDGYPENIEFKDFTGNFGGAIKAANSKLIIGKTSDPSSQTVDIQGSLTVNQASGNVALKDAANTFTRRQTFQSSIDDAPLFTELLTNGEFDTDLAGWTDDSSGWIWDGGAATHDTGSDGTLSQIMTNQADVHVIELVVSGITTGWVEAHSSFFNLDAYADSGTATTIRGIGLIQADETITIEVGDGFDGRIEAVSVKQVLAGGFPATLIFNDYNGQYVGSLKAVDGILFLGDDTNPSAQAIQLSAQFVNVAALPTSPGPSGTLWVDEANGGVVKRA